MTRSQNDITDEQLMLAYQKGDAQAFEVLLTRYKKRIHDFLYRFLNQKQNVEEAFQEVFLRVIQSAHSYIPTAKFSTWIYTVARNFCIDQSRKNRLRKTSSLYPSNSDGEEMNHEERYASNDPTPDITAGAIDLETKLNDALSRINPDQKEVFLMRERGGLAFEEIAQVVGVSVNTVKSRMRYALNALQEEFKKLGILEPK